VSAGFRADTQRFDAMDGQRFDHSGLSANATVSYALNEHVEVYGAAARTWLGVEQGEIGYYHARNYTYDPDLKPAWAMNYKVGLNFGAGSWQGGVGLFDTTIHDSADFRVISPAQGYRGNAAELRSRGIDVSLTYLWTTGRAGARLSHADVTYDGDTVQPGTREAAPVGTTAALFIDQRVPDWHATFGATVTIARKIDDDDLIASGFAPEPGYTVVDAYATWNPQGNANLTLRLDVNNLFDKAYFVRTNYPTMANGSVVAMPAPGRTVAVGMSYRF
jgi:hemoglobin/transferrin/lactoferrin receptor protein